MYLIKSATCIRINALLDLEHEVPSDLETTCEDTKNGSVQKISTEISAIQGGGGEMS